MMATPDSLAPEFRNDSNVEPPYSNAQISKTAVHREILRTYQSARKETKAVYDLSRDSDRVEEENWVIRWMLWHAFRYRDNRNKNRRPPGDGDGADASILNETGMSPISQPSRHFPVSCRRGCGANSGDRRKERNDSLAILGSGSQRMMFECARICTLMAHELIAEDTV
jgi:hypothetical protein